MESSSQTPIPILLLKTPSTPTDTYHAHFSSLAVPVSPHTPSLRFSPQFVPVLTNHTIPSAFTRLIHILGSGSFPGSKCTFPSSPDEPPRQYGGLILTSQRASEVLVSALYDLLVPTESLTDSTYLHPSFPTDLPIYTVGPATSRVLLAPLPPWGVPQSSARVRQVQLFGQHTGNGEKLAAFILQHYKSSLPLLFPVGRDHRPIIHDTLTQNGIGVDELIVYETTPMPGFEDKLLQTLEAVGAGPARWDDDAASSVTASTTTLVGDTASVPEPWVLLFSPTGCDSVVSALGLGPSRDGPRPDGVKPRVRIATIGPTTRDHLREKFGVEVDVCAEQPTPEGIAGGIVSFLQRTSMEVHASGGPVEDSGEYQTPSRGTTRG